MPIKDFRNKKYVFFIFPLIIVFATVVACAFFYAEATKTAEKQAYSVINDSSSAQLKTLKAALDGRFTTLEAYANAFSKESDFSFGSEKTNSMLGLVKDGDYQFDLFLIDGKGIGHLYDGSCFNVSDRSYFKKSFAGERAIELLSRGRRSGLPRLMLAVPLKRDGKCIGSVASTFDADAFKNLLVSEVYNYSGFSIVCDSRGNVIIASNHPLFERTNNVLNVITNDRIVGENSVEQILDNMSQSEKGSISYMHGGIERFAVYLPTGINDWIIFNVVPKSVINNAVYDASRITYFITISVAVLSLILLLFVYFSQEQSRRIIEDERQDFRVAATQSGRMVRIFDIKENRLLNTYSNGGLAWENTPEDMVKNGCVAPESVSAYLEFYKKIRSGMPSGAADARMKNSSGDMRWHHAEYTLITDKSGKPKHAVISVYDNSAQMQKELAYELRRSELSALNESDVFYLEANLMTGDIETTSGEAVNLSAFSGNKSNFHELVDWDAHTNVYPDDVKGFCTFFDRNRLIAMYKKGEFTDSFEFRAKLMGELTWNKATIQLVKYPYTDDIKLYAVYSNVGDEHKEREILLGMASGDSLTGLLNRKATMLKIEQFLNSDDCDGMHALFMIDVDNFKLVNDTMGHLMGDRALIAIANAIRGCFRETDVIGRIGGDEFFAFMKNAGSIKLIRAKARELIAALQYTCESESNCMSLSGSVGISVYSGEKTKTLKQLYSEADEALYKAKALGKNCYSFTDETECVVDSKETEDESSDSGLMSMNLRSLLNNLEIGIAIYRGNSQGRLLPLFCNESMLNLLGGIDEKQFKEIYGTDAFSGVHPDDRTELVRTYYSALRSCHSFRYTYRILGLGECYFPVTASVSFVKYGDGSFDVYAVYSKADNINADTPENG